MIRSFRFALATLVGPWLVILVAVFEVCLALLRDAEWRGDGLWTVDWFAIGLFYLLPVVAGVAAIDAARLTRDGCLHVLRTTRKGRWVLFRAALWSAIPVVVVHVLTILTGWIVGEVLSPTIGWVPLLLSLAVQVIAIVWAGCLGSLFGRLLPTLLAAVMAVTLMFIAVLAIGESSGKRAFHPFAFGASSIQRIGWTVNDTYLGVQLLLFVATALLMLAVPARSSTTRRVFSRRGAALGMAVVVAFFVTGTWGPTKRLQSYPAEPTRCSYMGGYFTVCFFPEHERIAFSNAELLASLFSQARNKGYSAITPREVLEASHNFEPGGPGIQAYLVTTEMLRSSEPTMNEVIGALTVGSFHCPYQLNERGEAKPPPEEYWRDLESLRMTWRSIGNVEQPDAPKDSPSHVLSPDMAAKVVERMSTCGYY